MLLCSNVYFSLCTPLFCRAAYLRVSRRHPSTRGRQLSTLFNFQIEFECPERDQDERRADEGQRRHCFKPGWKTLKCFVIFQSVLAPILNSKSSLSFHLFAAKLSALNQFKISRSAIPCCSPFRIKAILCHVLFSLIAAAEPYLDSTCSKFLLSFSLPMLQKRRPLPTRQQLAALVGVVATASSTCRGTVDARS